MDLSGFTTTPGALDLPVEQGCGNAPCIPRDGAAYPRRSKIERDSDRKKQRKEQKFVGYRIVDFLKKIAKDEHVKTRSTMKLQELKMS
jgi:hypothetical protein